jgi:integrase
MLIVGKTLFKWGVPRNFAPANPFREVAPIPTEDDGHRPWPDWAVELVLNTAPADLRRFVFLAQATGQRESDVVRMGTSWREGRGLWVRPLKTRKRRRAFFVPLTLADAAEYVRHGATGPRRRGTIGFSVVRGGDIVGDHRVIFAGPGEQIERAHHAQDRSGFARGALAAARWVVGRPPGLYSMMDVLGL